MLRLPHYCYPFCNADKVTLTLMCRQLLTFEQRLGRLLIYEVYHEWNDLVAYWFFGVTLVELRLDSWLHNSSKLKRNIRLAYLIRSLGSQLQLTPLTMWFPSNVTSTVTWYCLRAIDCCVGVHDFLFRLLWPVSEGHMWGFCRLVLKSKRNTLRQITQLAQISLWELTLCWWGIFRRLWAQNASHVGCPKVHLTQW